MTPLVQRHPIVYLGWLLPAAAVLSSCARVCETDACADVPPSPSSVDMPCGSRSGLQPGAPSPTSGGCATGSYASPFDGPASLSVIWQASLGTRKDCGLRACEDRSLVAVEYSTPAVGADGLVVAGSSVDGSLRAFDARDGRARWLFPTGAAAFGPATLGRTGLAYGVATDAVLYAIDSLSGALVWSSPSHWPSFAIADDKLWIKPLAADGPSVLDVASGRPTDLRPRGYGLGSGPVRFDGAAIIIASASGATAFALDSTVLGQVASMLPDEPVLTAGRTIYMSFPDRTTLLQRGPLFSGRGWEAVMPDGARITSSPAVSSEIVVVPFGKDTSGNSGLVALDPARGGARWTWRSKSSRRVTSPLIAGNGLVFVAAEDEGLYCIDATTGGVRAFLALDGAPSSPALGRDRTLFLTLSLSPKRPNDAAIVAVGDLPGGH